MRKEVVESSSLDVVALAVFGATMLGMCATILFMDGVFSFYGISILDVGYIFQPVDFLISLVPVLITVVIFLVVQIIMDWLLDKADLSKPEATISKFYSVPDSQRKAFQRRVMVVFGMIMFLVLMYGSVKIIPQYGLSYARNKELYSSISGPSDDIQLLIIRNMGDQILVKPYSQSENKFQDGFEIRSSSDVKYRSFNIEKGN